MLCCSHIAKTLLLLLQLLALVAAAVGSPSQNRTESTAQFQPLKLPSPYLIPVWCKWAVTNLDKVPRKDHDAVKMRCPPFVTADVMFPPNLTLTPPKGATASPTAGGQAASGKSGRRALLAPAAATPSLSASSFGSGAPTPAAAPSSTAGSAVAPDFQQCARWSQCSTTFCQESVRTKCGAWSRALDEYFQAQFNEGYKRYKASKQGQ